VWTFYNWRKFYKEPILHQCPVVFPRHLLSLSRPQLSIFK
jgi:hypothetical protein